MSDTARKQDQEPAREIDFRVLGSTGLRRTGGQINEEWHPKLRGRLAVRVLREMRDNDPLIGGFLLAVENLIRQVDYPVIPSGDTERHKQEAEFLESVIQDMSNTWQDILSEILTMLPFGWALLEINYKQRLGPTQEDPTKRSRFDDGRTGWRNLSIRSQESLDRWEFDDGGGIKGMWQVAPPDYQLRFIPIGKALLFRTQTHKNSPEGRSYLRNAFRSWRLLKRLQEIEAVGAERDLVGLPVAKVPPKIMDPKPSPEDALIRAEIEKIVQQVRRDEREGLVWPADVDEDGTPTGYSFELLSSGGQRQFNLHQSIVRYEQRILTSVLFQFLLLGQDHVGSFALASSQTNLTGYALAALLDAITDVFNRFAIPRLFGFNGVPTEFWPRLEHGDIEKPELTEFSNYIVKGLDSGVLTPDDELEKTYREYGGLPAREPAEKDAEASETKEAAKEVAEGEPPGIWEW